MISTTAIRTHWNSIICFLWKTTEISSFEYVSIFIASLAVGDSHISTFYRQGRLRQEMGFDWLETHTHIYTVIRRICWFAVPPSNHHSASLEWFYGGIFSAVDTHPILSPSSFEFWVPTVQLPWVMCWLNLKGSEGKENFSSTLLRSLAGLKIKLARTD